MGATQEPLRIVHTKLKYHFKGKCLDIGCDKGRHLKLMPEGSFGIDTRDYGFKNVIIEDLNRNQIPFGNEYFDTVFCSHVIEHLNSPHLFLKEIHRVTKTTLIIGIPNINYPFEDLYDQETRPYHIYPWGWHAFKIFLETHGFKVKKIYRNHPTKNRIIGWFFNTFLKHVGSDHFFVCEKKC